MAKGKSQYCTWFCTNKRENKNSEKVKDTCNRANYVTYYNKRNDNVLKVKNKFCPTCRVHSEHKRKDTKKGN